VFALQADSALVGLPPGKARLRRRFVVVSEIVTLKYKRAGLAPALCSQMRFGVLDPHKEGEVGACGIGVRVR
jgi:hypothetical protein